VNIKAILLSPFSLINGCVLRLRHLLFDIGFLASRTVPIPTIRIGNLSFGGTGKTPFAEYILSQFSGEINMSVLSRGYGREGNDLHEVNPNDNSKKSGDEPLQIKKKFPQIPVILNGDRVEGVQHILDNYLECGCVLLDDALQHRKLKGGLQIMLTTIQNPFFHDYLFPSGKLRDIRSRAKNFDAIVFTKIEEAYFDEAKRNWLLQAVNKYNKPTFFTSLEYSSPKHILNNASLPPASYESVLLLTGIANAEPLLNKLEEDYVNCHHLDFNDHHEFSKDDILKIKEKYNGLKGESVIFTTEKDAQRLLSNDYFDELKDLDIYFIEIKIKFLEKEEAFKTLIRNYVGNNKRSS